MERHLDCSGGQICINGFHPLTPIDLSITPRDNFAIMRIVTKDRTKFKLLTFELRIWLDECTHINNLNLSAQGRSFKSSLAFHFQANIDHDIKATRLFHFCTPDGGKGCDRCETCFTFLFSFILHLFSKNCESCWTS